MSGSSRDVLHKTVLHLTQTAARKLPDRTAAEPRRATDERKMLLTDAQIADYVRTGIHVLPLQEELGAAYHDDVNKKVVGLWSNGGTSRCVECNGCREFAGKLQSHGRVHAVVGTPCCDYAWRAAHVTDRLPSAGRFGNNIYPGVPELAGVLQTPSVRGALTSILGEDYCMHAHRALHLYEGMGNEQGFHQGDERRHMAIQCVAVRVLVF